MLKELSILKYNYSYYIILILVIFLCSYISYDNISFDLYFNDKYIDYSNFFKSFDFSVFPDNYSTFPMWGYGLFHLLGVNKILFLVIQQIITFFTLVYLDKQIIYLKIIDKIENFRLLIVLSFPWFLFHTQMWEKSISSNLLLLAIIILVDFLKNKKNKSLIISAILFGFLSNFRSDYNYLYIAFFILIIFYEGRSSFRSFLEKMLFPGIIILLLTPWMIFTFKQTGQPLLTSTNSGHVLYIGLGQLPNNSWGITPRDDDKVMDLLLKNNFNAGYKSYNYRENIYLKKKFSELIKKNPKEWIKKCLFAFRLFILDPFYVGNIGNFQHNKFANIYEIRELEKLIYNFEIKKGVELIKKTKWEFTKKEFSQFIFTFFVKFQGVILIFSFFISLILCLKKFGGRLLKDKLILIFLLTIGYQVSIAVFAFHMPVYNNTIFIIYLLLTYLFFQKYLSIKQ